MMKNKIFFIVLLTFFILSLTITATDAYFTKTHRYFDLKAFSEVNSPITQRCAPYLINVLDGESARDVPVLHYQDDKVFSYIFTHTRSGVDNGFSNAGTDDELFCDSIGGGLHNVEDHFSHIDTDGSGNEDGLVPKYLRNSKMPNLIGHAAIENNYEDKLFIYLKEKQEPLVIDGTVDFYDSITLDTYFANEKFVKQLNFITGIDTTNDLNIFANGYKGVGFYDTVYNQKLKLPFWFWAISIGMTIIGIGVALLLFFTGKTAWKYLSIIPWLFFAGFGILVLVSFFTNSTWAWAQLFLRFFSNFELFTTIGILFITTGALIGVIGFIKDRLSKFSLYLSLSIIVLGVILILLPTLGLINSSSLEVSDQDVILYHDITLRAAKKYLETGVLPFDDNSGLSYVSKDGVSIEGSLIKAQAPFKYVLLPLLALIFGIINMFLIIKTYSIKTKK